MDEKEKEKREYCANCKNRHGWVDGSGNTHCGRYTEKTERYCIVNFHKFWEPEARSNG